MNFASIRVGDARPNRTAWVPALPLGASRIAYAVEP
jgi:hypothetical protein